MASSGVESLEQFDVLATLEELRELYPKSLTYQYGTQRVRIKPRYDSDGRVANEELALIRMQLAGSPNGFMKLQFTEWYMRVYIPNIYRDII